MKLKKVLALLLTTTTVMSMSVGNAAFAAGQNTQVEAQQNTGGAETGSGQSNDETHSQLSQEFAETVEQHTADQSDGDTDESVEKKSVQEDETEVHDQETKEGEEVAVHASENVYLNMENGSDSNDGLTAENAVKTLDQAIKLAGQGGTIYTETVIAIDTDTTLSDITLKRDPSLITAISVIQIRNGATLTLQNVMVDGATEANIKGYSIEVTDRGHLIIDGFTKICNSKETAITVSENSSVVMNGGEICDNEGAIATEGTVNITGGNIYNNSAKNGGAVVTFEQGKTTITGGTISNNTATDGGGAFDVHGEGTLEISGGTITENIAGWGAAINAYDHATVKLSGTGSIIKNVSEKNGGAICLEGGVDPTDGDGSMFVMTGGSITGNVAGHGGEWGAGGAVYGYAWQGPTDIQILGGTISGNTSMDGGNGIFLTGDTGYGIATLKFGGSPTIKDEVFLGDLTNFPNTKAEVISAFTPNGSVPITDGGWLDNRVIVSYANGLSANIDAFTPADGNDDSVIIQDGQDLRSMNKVSVSFVEKGYVADENYRVFKSILVLPTDKISKDEIPAIDDKPGYTVNGWNDAETDKEWDFDKDTVTKMTQLYPDFKLNPAVFELKADKDHIHGEDGDKVTLTTEFTAHEADNVSYEWQWYKDGTTISDGKSNGTLEVTEPGVYKVIVTAYDGSIYSEAVEKTITITKNDHEYDGWDYDAIQHWKTCKECQRKADVNVHIFGDWSIENQAKSTKTVKVRICQVCGYEESVTVPEEPEKPKEPEDKNDKSDIASTTVKNDTTTVKNITTSVRTGDRSQTGIWTAAIMLSGILTAIIAFLRRRKYF